MTIQLNDLAIPTAVGTWRTEYIGEPKTSTETDRVDYYIRFKWIDPDDPDNKETPERRLRLTIYHSQSAHQDYEEKLHHAIYVWLESDEASAIYNYPSFGLEAPAE